MAREYDLVPRPVPRVESPFRRIVTDFPVPESLPILERLARWEPLAMRGQPPVVWERADGFQVWDAWGNRWLDWSSGALIANAGHGRKEICDAIIGQAEKRQLAANAFPGEMRARLVERLSALAPAPLKKVLLLTTGSEAVECAIRICRTYGVKQGGRSKHVIVSFESAPALKEGPVNLDRRFVQVPFPDGYWTEDVSFESFERHLFEAGFEPQNVAGVVAETYQRTTAAFAPRSYMQDLRQWCTGHKALLVADDVEAGFGRTGALFGFEHYGIVPDLACFGKGISSSLPLSAVMGRADVMDVLPASAITPSHAGNPVCAAAALASIDLVVSEDLPARAATAGSALHRMLVNLQSRFPQIGTVTGKGLVAGVICVRPGTRNPDGELAWDVVRRSVEKGVLLFSPVGHEGSTIKICPPLVITEAALADGAAAFEEAFAEALSKRQAV